MMTFTETLVVTCTIFVLLTLLAIGIYQGPPNNKYKVTLYLNGKEEVYIVKTKPHPNKDGSISLYINDSWIEYYGTYKVIELKEKQ